MSDVSVFAVKHKNLETRMESRSGGIFTALSDLVFNNRGVVYGAVLKDDFTVEHIRAKTINDRDRMRGSKYVQSEMCDCYKAVKMDLETGQEVMFTGTSCQIAGLKAFLGEDYENLLCVDIVCHGVPSPKVWKEYLKWVEHKKKKKIIAVDFRNKKDFGWTAHYETLYFGDQTSWSSRIYTALFYGHNILRPSCYQCPYKSIQHPGDITIADYWGIDRAAPGFSDDKGVSLVLINNNKGSHYFEKAKKDLIWKQTKIEDSMQPPLKAPFPVPADRKEFWKDMDVRSFSYVASKYGENSILFKLKAAARKLLR